MAQIYRMTGPTSDQGEPMFAWRDNSGCMHVLGERAEVCELHAALGALLAGTEPETISEYDPAWGHNYTISQAVEEAIAYGYGADRERMADSIRAACRRGAIRGATLANGHWSIPPRTLRGWLVRSADERRGRPRKEERG